MNIPEIVSAQKKYFSSGATRCINNRKKQLKNLYSCICAHEKNIESALFQDLAKPEFESYETEIGIVLADIHCMIKNIAKWSKPKRVSIPLANFPSHGKVFSDPYGTVLIMSPWNYPFMLAIEPLAEAVAAGNTVVVKPSSQAPATNFIINKIISETFSAEHVCCVCGSHEINDELLVQKFDFIFFTGSAPTGKKIMKAAAENLTPVCLELGGKNPCIIDETANIQLAARRIVWGKFMNAGQTCVAPDYILIHESVADAFIATVKEEIKKQYGENPIKSSSLVKIINKKHFDRLTSLAPEAVADAESCKIAPTVIKIVPDSPLMQEEIFGPILPVITYCSIDDVISFVSEKDKPLALYLFSTSRRAQKLITSSLRFGSGAINDVVVQLSAEKIPFGGVGASGIGSYHGKYGFDTFTHYKGILTKSNAIDIPIRYSPYGNKINILRKFLH